MFDFMSYHLPVAGYQPTSKKMKCPHCTVEIFDQVINVYTDNDKYGHWAIGKQECPACEQVILTMGRFNGEPILLYPRAPVRPKPPAEVPDEFAEDYIEA